jgi:large subunit ribosomal protein L22
MEVVARTQSVRISPRKVRLVVDGVKKMSVDQALRSLSIIPNRPANVLAKTLRSAIANAVNNAKLAESDLVIDRIEVTEAQALKRYHPSTRGRVHPYKKRGSHIRVVLKEKVVESKVMQVKTEKKKEVKK